MVANPQSSVCRSFMQASKRVCVLAVCLKGRDPPDGCFFPSDENSFLVSLSPADSLAWIRRDVGNYRENKSHVTLLIDPRFENYLINRFTNSTCLDSQYKH